MSPGGIVFCVIERCDLILYVNVKHPFELTKVASAA
jgi:hypothetical protein